MIVFRIIQGFAVSADYPTAMAILAITFTDMKERAQALGIWSAAFAVASVFGPLIGGPLIDNFNWRAVFFVNIPLGIIGLFLALTFIDESVGEKRSAKFDWWGAIYAWRRALYAHARAGPRADMGMVVACERRVLYWHIVFSASYSIRWRPTKTSRSWTSSSSRSRVRLYAAQ